jgi:hypothetical protein
MDLNRGLISYQQANVPWFLIEGGLPIMVMFLQIIF